MINMLFSNFAENADIIKLNVHYNKLVEVRPKQVIHGTLKGAGRLGETKAKHFELIVPKDRTKSCLFQILRYADLMLP